MIYYVLEPKGQSPYHLLSDEIRKEIPGEVIKAIIEGRELLQSMRDMGFMIYSTGGETADVGDLVRSIIVDSTVTAVYE